MSGSDQNPNRNENNGYFKLGAAMCILASFAAWSSYPFVTSSFKNSLEANMESEYPFTYVGRRLANQDFMKDKTFFSGELFLVQYRGQYYVVNQDLNMLGTNDFFQVVEDKNERGMKYQILEEDIIPFFTVLINGKVKLTLLEAYEMVENWNYSIPLFPEYQEISYPINEKPTEEGMNFVKNVNSSQELVHYQLSNLYVVNQNGNLYLCREDRPGVFSILQNGINEFSTFSFVIGEGEGFISKWQVQKLSKILSEAGFSYQPYSTYSLVSCYQLLNTANEILDGIDFSLSYESYQGYTKSQLQYASQYLALGEFYLDDYHLDLNETCQFYSPDEIYIAKINHSFVLFSSLRLDEEGYYHLVPIHSSKTISPELIISDSIPIIPFSSLFDIPDVDQQKASYYYTVLRDFLVKNGPDFLFSKNDFHEELSVLEDLGKKLQLSLTYQE